jgi:hypothetical protein
MKVDTFIGGGKIVNKLKEIGYIMRPIHSYSRIVADYELMSRLKCPRIHVLVRECRCYAHIDLPDDEGGHYAIPVKSINSFNAIYQSEKYFTKKTKR